MAEQVIFELSVLVWRINNEAEPRDWATKKFELAVRISEVLPLARANQKRIRTAQLGNREKPALLSVRGPELAVSGSDARGLDGQDPAESRSFLGLFPTVRPKSLRQKTRWRRPKSLIDRENAGKLSRSRLPARPASPIRPRSAS